VTLDWIDGYAYREMTFHSPATATATSAIPPAITKEIQRSLAFIGSSIDHLYTSKPPRPHPALIWAAFRWLFLAE
jgi:hypothetical protein